MKEITTSTYSFENVIKGGFVYVDKTALVHHLASKKSGQFFISRPRRFGKSLMISTLKYLFQGRRDLFKGLAIDSMDWDWQKYSVIHLDLSAIDSASMEKFERDLIDTVEMTLRKSGYTYNRDSSPGINLGLAIDELAEKSGKGVILLIDEYDAPVGHALNDIERAQKIREALSAFYINIKHHEENVRFLMMMGVSKFTQLSVFSALNNLDDISFNNKYAALFGYTDEELDVYFSQHMHKHAEIMGKSYEDYRAGLKFWCNGYRFSRSNFTRVYNPVAIGKTLANCESAFVRSWAATGRATSLMNHLKKNELVSLDYENLTDVEESEFDVCGLEDISTIGLLYQTGYLTIKEYDPDLKLYTLGVPNQEIREDLARLILYLKKGEKEGLKLHKDVMSGLLKNDSLRVEKALCALYADLTYGPTEKVVPEAAYQRVLHTILAAGGFDVTSEKQQAIGRPDLIAKHKLGIFVIELKVDESADAALAQIEEKQYCASYVNASAPVYAVGINFNSKTRNIDSFMIVQCKA